MSNIELVKKKSKLHLFFNEIQIGKFHNYRLL